MSKSRKRIPADYPRLRAELKAILMYGSGAARLGIRCYIRALYRKLAN